MHPLNPLSDNAPWCTLLYHFTLSNVRWFYSSREEWAATQWKNIFTWWVAKISSWYGHHQTCSLKLLVLQRTTFSLEPKHNHKFWSFKAPSNCFNWWFPYSQEHCQGRRLWRSIRSLGYFVSLLDTGYNTVVYPRASKEHWIIVCYHIKENSFHQYFIKNHYGNPLSGSMHSSLDE